MADKNLVIDYMNETGLTLAAARHDLHRVGNNCWSVTEFLDKIGFGIDYTIQAMDFVPKYKNY